MEALLIIINLILIEGILSIDNAAVLAAMVKPYPKETQRKLMTWGIGGAYLFRGICLFFAAWLASFMWLKILGGAYLLFLVYKFMKGSEEDNTIKTLSGAGLVALIIQIEIMDLSFSIDNVFAAVAMSDNIWIVCLGVFIGILAMRFASKYFVILLERYPGLEATTYMVITLLGLKLMVSGAVHYMSMPALETLLNSEYTDLGFSALILIVFGLGIYFGKKKGGLVSC